MGMGMFPTFAWSHNRLGSISFFFFGSPCPFSPIQHLAKANRPPAFHVQEANSLDSLHTTCTEVLFLEHL